VPTDERSNAEMLKIVISLFMETLPHRSSQLEIHWSLHRTAPARNPRAL
jgi:hypothetical protein